MASFHFNVATEGVRASHKIFSVLGLKWITIEVIPPPTFEPWQLGQGGYGVGDDYYTIRITINLNGKKTVKEYKTLILDTVVRFSISLKTIVESIVASFRESRIINKLLESKVKSVQEVRPEILVEQKDIKIEVKRK